MWDELSKEIGVELAQLDELLSVHRSLLDKCRTTAPDPIERSALAAVLHAFYTGVENIFERVATHVEGGKRQASAWHQELLNSMAASTPTRCAVISPETTARLSEYLAFRHVFRHSYTFQLRWAKMKGLVLGLDQMLTNLREELREFLESQDHENVR